MLGHPAKSHSLDDIIGQLGTFAIRARNLTSVDSASYRTPWRVAAATVGSVTSIVYGKSNCQHYITQPSISGYQEITFCDVGHNNRHQKTNRHSRVFQLATTQIPDCVSQIKKQGNHH